jgi:hypothetical protein
MVLRSCNAEVLRLRFTAKVEFEAKVQETKQGLRNKSVAVLRSCG